MAVPVSATAVSALRSANAQSDAIVIEAHGGEAFVPGPPGFIVGADYARSGWDLKLADKDGHEAVIKDFFKVEHPPELVSAEGAHIPADLAMKLAGPLAPGQYAQAAPGAGNAPIGQVQTVQGAATATHTDGTKAALAIGTPIFQGDILETGANSSLGVVFVDKTTFAMQDGSRMVIDRMIFDPGSKQGSQVFSLLQGAFVAVTGEIALTSPQSVTVNTPVAAIGIRGTEFAVVISQQLGQTLFTLLAGAISVSNALGQVVLNTAGLTTLGTSFNAPPAPPFTLPQAQFNTLYGAGAAITEQLRPFGVRPQQQQQQQNQNQPNPNELQQVQSADPAAGADQQGQAGANKTFGASKVFEDLAGLSNLQVANALGVGPDSGFKFGDAGPFAFGGEGGDRHQLFFIPEPTAESGPPVIEILPGNNPGQAIVRDGTELVVDSPDEIPIIVGGAADETLIVRDLSGTTFANDTIFFFANGGNDTLSAEEATNPIVADGGPGNDVFNSGSGNDVLAGGTGNDVLNGGSGNDSLEGGPGDDTLAGGAGIDTASFVSTTAGVTVDLAAGTAVGSESGSDQLSGIENVVGGEGSDTLVGAAGANLLIGGAGDDTLDGGAGDDQLVGGTGSDTVSYAWTTTGVTVNLSAGTGVSSDATDGSAAKTTINVTAGDVITFSWSFDAGDYIPFGDYAFVVVNGEALKLAGIADTGNYNALPWQTFTFTATTTGLLELGFGVVNTGDEVLDSFLLVDKLAINGVVVDSLESGDLTGWSTSGAVTVVTSHENDDAVFPSTYLPTDGTFLLQLQSQPTDQAAIESFLGIDGGVLDTLANFGTGAATGSESGTDQLSSIENVIGGAGNDTLTGDAGNNVLDGGAGDDTMAGGTGSDTASFAWTTAGVTVDLDANTAVGGESGSDQLSSIENVIGGSGDDMLFGSTGNDSLNGGDGSDFLEGHHGSDTLVGGAGADIYGYDDPGSIGGAQNGDGFIITTNRVKAAGENGDFIVGFQSGTDVIDFSADYGLDGNFFSTIAGPYDGTNAGTNDQWSAGQAALIYSTADQTLYYDANGSGAGYQVVATVQSGTAIQAADVTAATVGT